MSKNKILSLIALTVFLLSIALAKTFAVEYTKTIETFVASYASQVSTSQDADFTLYIGDNISSVSSPIKSNFFTVTGIYTGSGNIGFTIDSDGDTSKTFTLPNVGSNPTSFEIIYKDKEGKMSPTTAGEYDHALNIAPSGVTISGLSAKLTTTYRYAATACDDGQLADEKIKSEQSFVMDSDSQFSNSVNSDFDIYIGDNISGVTEPIKSTFFVVSGVYTSSGAPTLQLQIDASSTKVFTFPQVTSPTSFEIIYKDIAEIISPTTAGSYTYNFVADANNMTISGFGVKATITYQYKPPVCGGNYPPYGDLISQTFDTNSDGAAYNSIMWKGVLGDPPNNVGKIKFQFAASDCANGATNAPTCNTGGWGTGASDYIGGALCNNADFYETTGPDAPVEIKCAGANHNNKKYYLYKIRVCSANDCSASGDYTPVIQDIVVSWSP